MNSVDVAGSAGSGPVIAVEAGLDERRRLHLLNSIASNVTDAVMIAQMTPGEREPRIVYVNAAFEHMTGYPAHELLGASPRMLQGPLTSLAARRRIRRALEAVEPVDLQVLNYRKSGETYLVEIELIPDTASDGTTRHWIAIERDISARLVIDVIAEYTGSIEAENAKLATEIAEHERAEATLAYSAFHDSLTGLHNRAYFFERLSAALARFHGRRLPGTPSCFSISTGSNSSTTRSATQPATPYSRTSPRGCDRNSGTTIRSRASVVTSLPF